MRRPFLFAAFFFAGWGFISCLSYDVGFVSTLITQFFAGGKTNFKEYFFFAWATFLFALLALPLRPPSRKWGKTLMAVVGITMVLNLICHVWYSHKVGIHIGDFSIAVSHRLFSANSLVHMHVLKSTLFLPMRILAIDPNRIWGDSGTPFFFLIPTPLVIAGLILALTAVFLTAVVAVEKTHEWSGRRFWPHWLALAVSSYAVLKSLVDGGPFSTEFLVYFPPFACLILTSPSSAGSLIRAVLRWWIAALLLVLALHVLFHLPFLQDLLVDVVLLAVFFCAFLLVTEWIVTGSGYRHRYHLLWMVPLIIGISFHHFRFDGFKLLSKRLKSGDTLIVSDYFRPEFPFDVKFSDGAMKVYSARITEPSSVWAFYRKYRIPPNFTPINIPGDTCRLETPYPLSGTVTIVAGRVSFQPRAFGLFESFHIERCPTEKSCDYHYEAIVKGCVPDNYSESVLHYFTEAGAERFVIVPDDMDQNQTTKRKKK